MVRVALIPARGGSKGIKRKNIKSFLNKPLIYWSIKIALDSNYFDRVIVSTEDQEIANIAKKFSAEVPYLRPQEFAKDESAGIEPVLDILEKIPEITDLLLLQPTSPLRRIEDIEEIFKLREFHDSDSAVSITPSTKPLSLHVELNNKNEIIPLSNNYDIKPRQQYPKNYTFNGSLYLSKKDSIIKHKSLITPKTIGYVMPEKYSIDIDTEFDWEIAEYFMSKIL